MSRPSENRLTSKKKTRLAEEADPEERKTYQKGQAKLDVGRSIFIDEFGVHSGMNRHYARAPEGLRAEMIEPFQKEVKLSVIGSIRLAGVGPTLSIEGAIDGEIFHQYVQQFLLPQLRKGDIVLLDNAKIHHKQQTIELIETVGAKVKHIPAYSPDFNPMEQCISKIKTDLRSRKPKTRITIERTIAKSMNEVTTKNIRGWFKHCGYTCPDN